MAFNRVTMSKTTKPKAEPKRKTAVDEQPAQHIYSAQLQRDIDNAEEIRKWVNRFNFIANLDPIQFKRFYRTVQTTGMSASQVVDSQRGSFPDKGI